MGHLSQPTTIFVGLAQLPQPLVAVATDVAVELEVERDSRTIVAAASSLNFTCLERLLAEVLVGRTVDSAAGSTARELDARYSAAFTKAVATAVQAALHRAGGPSNG